MVDQVKPPSLSEIAAKARSEVVSRAGEPVVKRDSIAGARRIFPAQDKSEWFFEASKPNFSFIYKVTRKQVRFEGLFFKTDDRKLASYINKCYGGEVQEILKEQYEEFTVLKSGGPEPVKSSIVVNRLPERNT